jgi:hypothetical protein
VVPSENTVPLLELLAAVVVPQSVPFTAIRPAKGTWGFNYVPKYPSRGNTVNFDIYVPSVSTSDAFETPHYADGFVQFIVAFILGLANDTDTIALLWKSVSGYTSFIVRWGTWGGRSADRLTPV